MEKIERFIYIMGGGILKDVGAAKRSIVKSTTGDASGLLVW